MRGREPNSVVSELRTSICNQFKPAHMEVASVALWRQSGTAEVQPHPLAPHGFSSCWSVGTHGQIVTVLGDR